MMPASDSLDALTMTMNRMSEFLPFYELGRVLGFLFRTTLERQLRSGLQQRLEAADDFVPTTARPSRLPFTRQQRREFRRPGDVVRYGELRDAGSHWLRLPGHARRRPRFYFLRP